MVTYIINFAKRQKKSIIDGKLSSLLLAGRFYVSEVQQNILFVFNVKHFIKIVEQIHRVDSNRRKVNANI